MSSIKIKLGSELIGRHTFNKEWNVKELYDILMLLQDKDAASDDPSISKMKYFYLKLYGYYDPKIVKNQYVHKCVYCPDNPLYNRFQDYNELVDDKENVLVLKSQYNDFREYEICCAYYTDRENSKSDKKYTMELYGTKKSIFDKIKSKLFGKEMCL